MGLRVVNANTTVKDPIRIEGSGTTVLFTGVGCLLRVIINKDVANSTFTITDSDDTTLWVAEADAKGTFFYGFELRNGCKIVTADFTNGEILVAVDKGDWNI